MKNNKTGISMGGTIEYTRSEKTKQFIKKKDSQKKKRSKVCIKCEHNNEGYCDKHKNWCGKVNYICLNLPNPHEFKPKQINKNNNKTSTPKHVSKRKLKDLKNKCNSCANSNGNGHCNKHKQNINNALIICKTKNFKEKNELGQIIQPNFDTNKLNRKKP